MGLVQLGTRRVGFWMPGSATRALEEVPEGVRHVVVGTLQPGGEALLVAAADESGAPEWAVVIFGAAGASLISVWKDRLFAGVGDRAVLVDEAGAVVAQFEVPGELLLGASAVEDDLLLLTPTRLHRLADDGTTRWIAEIGQGQHHVLRADPARITLAALHEDERWNEIVVDARTGAVTPLE